MEAACERSGRVPSSVRLTAVTKGASFEAVRTLIELGETDLGESRASELIKRDAMVKEWIARRSLDPSFGAPAAPRWHMIGHLQRNKAKTVLPYAAMIHSVDSLRLAEEINEQSARFGRVTPILLEVNASGETSKQGVAVPATTHLSEQLSSLKNIELRGLMTMAPLTDEKNVIRLVFQRVRELFEEIVGGRMAGPSFRELSMGMSNDFEIGIESGATLVRIGTALFEGIELPKEEAPVE